MGDEQCLAALDQSDGVAHGRAHSGHELGVGLAPARPQGVEVVAPVLGVGQDPSVAVDGHALEVVAGLDEAGVRRRGEVEGGGGRAPVSRARSSGEVTTAAMSWPEADSTSATCSAICLPSSERW